MVEVLAISERRACSFAGLSRFSYRQAPAVGALTQTLSARIVELAHERRRFGYPAIGASTTCSAGKVTG